MMTRKTFHAVFGVAAAAVLSSVPAFGQDRPTYELPPITVVALQEADVLHAQAIALYETPARWTEAARLHVLASESLSKNDARSFQGFDRAARLFYYSGDHAAARKAMEKAAGVALATGDVLTAARAYVDAAFIAVHEGFPAKKREFVAEARKLADSEHMPSADREAILDRIEGGGARPLATAFLPSGAY